MKSPDELQSELFRICQGGEADDARALLQMGASVNCADEWDMTPLMYTCAYGRVTLAKLLLEHGADITLRDKLGRNARDVAMEMGETDIVEMIEVELGRMFPDVNR
jgi:ankyrin repeat protein